MEATGESMVRSSEFVRMSRDAIATNSDELCSAVEGVRVCVGVRLGFLGRGMYTYVCVCRGEEFDESKMRVEALCGGGGHPENMWVRFFTRVGR